MDGPRQEQDRNKVFQTEQETPNQLNIKHAEEKKATKRKFTNDVSQKNTIYT